MQDAPRRARRRDIEVSVSGGYDPSTTRADAPLIQAQRSVLERRGITPLMWPRKRRLVPRFVFVEYLNELAK